MLIHEHFASCCPQLLWSLNDAQCAQVRLVAAAVGMPAGSPSLAGAELSRGQPSGLEAPASEEEDEVHACPLFFSPPAEPAIGDPYFTSQCLGNKDQPISTRSRPTHDSLDEHFLALTSLRRAESHLSCTAHD